MSALAKVATYNLSVPYNFQGATVKEVVEMANDLLRAKFSVESLSALCYAVDIAWLKLFAMESGYGLSFCLKPVPVNSPENLLNENVRHPVLVLKQSYLTVQSAAASVNDAIAEDFYASGVGFSALQLLVSTAVPGAAQKIYSILVAVSPLLDRRTYEHGGNHYVCAASASPDLHEVSARLEQVASMGCSKFRSVVLVDVFAEHFCSFSSNPNHGFFHVVVAFAPYARSMGAKSELEHCSFASDSLSLDSACHMALRNAKNQFVGSSIRMRDLHTSVIRMKNGAEAVNCYVAVVIWSDHLPCNRMKGFDDQVFVSTGNGLPQAVINVNEILESSGAEGVILKDIAVLVEGASYNPLCQGKFCIVTWGQVKTRTKRRAIKTRKFRVFASGSGFSFEESRLDLVSQLAEAQVAQTSISAGGKSQTLPISFADRIVMNYSRGLNNNPPVIYVSLAVSPSLTA